MKRIVSFCLAAVAVLAPSFAFAQPEEVPAVVPVGQIQHPDVNESSGISPAKGKSGLFWTHNDSGLDYVYAMTKEGEPTGQWKIKDVDMENCEDIAVVGNRIYLADIGNNEENRNKVAVHMIPQPPPNRTGEVAVARTWMLEYPDDPFDSESFFVFKSSGYIISKQLNGGEARVYRFPLNKRGSSFKLEKLCKIDVNDKTRGADITPDGKRLAVITGSGAYLFQLTKGIPADGTLEPDLFVPFDHNSMEGCCFTPDGLLVTSESRDLFLFTDAGFHYGKKARGKNARR